MTGGVAKRQSVNALQARLWVLSPIQNNQKNPQKTKNQKPKKPTKTKPNPEEMKKILSHYSPLLGVSFSG
jgi:hypothetical protein